MLCGFLDHNVEFLLVGAYALSAHGLIRATCDIDLFVNPTLENSEKVYAALLQFGAPLNEVNAHAFEEKGIVFQIGVIPRRIDIITQIDGVSFNQCWQNREYIHCNNLKIPIICIDDLLLNKSASGRTKDKADIEWIKKNYQGS